MLFRSVSQSRYIEEKGIILSKWANKDSGTDRHAGYGPSNYIHSHNIDNSPFPRSGNKSVGYTEITFEQFKKHVLKQEDMDKEIIGYKLKESCKQYFDAVDIIAREFIISEQMTIEEYPTVIKRLDKAGVLDLWFEPVYEEEYPNITITINGYKGEFFNDYVKFGCAEIGKELFIQINKFILARFDCGISNKEIESVTIGKGTFTKEQIKQIAEYYLNKK